MTPFSVFLAAANLLYLLALPSVAGKILSAIGCLTVAALARSPLLSGSLGTEQRMRSGARLLPVVGAFTLPSLSVFSRIVPAFSRVDAALLVIAAWLVSLGWLLALERPPGAATPDATGGGRAVPPLTRAFIVWASLFWLVLVWKLGVGHVALSLAREDRLTLSFQLWETRPPSEHLFLIWLTGDDFARHIAYTNHLHPYALFLYLCAKSVQLATGLPIWVGRNLSPFVMAAVGVATFSVLLSRVRRAAPPAGLKFHITLFLGLGFLISEWHYWTALYSVNFDNLFPLVAYLNALVWASAQPRISERNTRVLVLASVAFGLFGWVYTLLTVLALWLYYGRLRGSVTLMYARNRGLVKASLVCAGLGIATYALPRLLILAKGYASSSSPYLFRAGLDGDTRYFQNIVQAVLQPYYGEAKTWSSLYAFVPLLVCAACVRRARTLPYRMFTQVVFLCAPYFFSVALFPQAVSIHPYLYDQLLFLPIAMMGVAWSLSAPVQQRLRGPYVLAALLLMLALLTSNFVAIAQAMQRVRS